MPKANSFLLVFIPLKQKATTIHTDIPLVRDFAWLPSIRLIVHIFPECRCRAFGRMVRRHGSQGAPFYSHPRNTVW